MPVNPGIQYKKAEEEYAKARTTKEKLKALKLMLQTVPRHKSSERLQKEIETKISKFKKLQEREEQQIKKRGFQYSIKKEGAATIALVGTTNTGKSTLLNKLTGAKVTIASYPFTTKKPVIGIYDYKGIKLQIIEIPSITKNFSFTPLGPTFLSLIRQSDLIILFFNSPREKSLLDKELEDAEINLPILIYNNQESIGDEIWKRLNLIKVQTKMPGKKPSYPPLALKKGSTIKDLAQHVHKDFIKKFRFARIWGRSAKFDGQVVGLNHALADDDVAELHLR